MSTSSSNPGFTTETQLARTPMKTARLLPLLAVIAGATLASTPARATPIAIDLGTPGTLTRDLSVPFSDLNATPIAGQTLSLDFVFDHDEYVRVFGVTGREYEISVRLQTDGGSGGVEHTSGFLLDAQGKALSLLSGSADSFLANGAFYAGLFPLFADDNGAPNLDLQAPFDHYGVHFDITLPVVPGVEVTGGTFRLYDYSIHPHAVFGIGPGLKPNIVPDTTNTLLLLCSTVGAFALASWRQSSVRRHAPSAPIPGMGSRSILRVRSPMQETQGAGQGS